MGIDAASGWILEELEDGERIPHASDYSEIVAEKNNINFSKLLQETLFSMIQVK